MGYDRLKQSVFEAGRIVCLWGIRAASDCGCFNYRDPMNAYEVESELKYSPEEIYSAVFLSTRPKVFFQYYRSFILSHPGEPGPALFALRRLQDDGKPVAVVSRSIYALPSRAGIRECYDMHGSVYDNECFHCGRQYDIGYMTNTSGVPVCGECGSLVRPKVILAGEMVPNSRITSSAEAISRADVLLVLGCTMKATLAQNAVKYFEGNKIILINEKEDYSDSMADLVFHGKPDDILPKIYEN